MSERLSATMAGARHADELMRSVVDELQCTFDLYLAEIQRLDSDGVLRIVAAAGSLAAEEQRFLISEQPIATGVNGRVARTGTMALISDTREDADYIVRDPHTDPQSELSLPIIVDGRVWGVLSLEEVRPAAFDGGDASLMRTVVSQLGVALHRIAIYGELEEALVTTLSVLGAVMDLRDPYTAQHEQAVAELAVRTAAELGLDHAQQQAIRFAALTHDVGKITIPPEILGKPGPLDDAEWQIMRGPTIVCADMLARIPFFEHVHPLVRSHHERWDGNGYPDALRGPEIPIGARILCVCDSYNAMVTSRPYRAGMSPGTALEELRRCAGSQFDPGVVTAFARALQA
jgi:HD-GYP domain-containing protein (c-di-GMP phosphodiesterase class II)